MSHHLPNPFDELDFNSAVSSPADARTAAADVAPQPDAASVDFPTSSFNLDVDAFMRSITDNQYPLRSPSSFHLEAMERQ